MAELPKGAVALYRICTEKSLLGFGKYADLPVGDILKVDESYIVFVYANYEKVSFKKEILQRLGVREIPKPGKDPEVLREWQRAQSANYTDEQRLHGRIKWARGRRSAARARLAEACRDTELSRDRLRAINHGNLRKH